MIHIYGDSHGEANLKRTTLPFINRCEYSTTMFRIGRDNSIIHFNKDDHKPDDVVCLTYGEIDCRCHIQRQIDLGRNEDHVIQELVEKYFDAINNNTTHLIKNHIIIFAVIPAVRQFDYEMINGPIKHEHPFVGSNEDRVRFTNKVNKLYEEFANKNGYTFFNPFSFYTRPDGSLKYEYSDYLIHIHENTHILTLFNELYNQITTINSNNNICDKPTQNVSIYVVNFKDEERKQRMTERFQKIGLDIYFTPPVYDSDPRIEPMPYKRTCSIMQQHLDSISHFLEHTDTEYCIVCEDDIYISKHLKEHLPIIINNFNELELDLLLLGYLFPYSPHNNWHFPILKSNEHYTFHGYPDDIWGSQMYMITRKHAKYLLETFTIQFALDNLEVVHFNPDWTLTKRGKRAVIYPMLAVEEGATKNHHQEQDIFHLMCMQHNYNPNVHI